MTKIEDTYYGENSLRYTEQEIAIVKENLGDISLSEIVAKMFKVTKIKRSIRSLQGFCGRNGWSYKLSTQAPAYSKEEIALIRKNAGVVPMATIVEMVNELGTYTRTAQAITSMGCKRGFKFKVVNYEKYET